MKVKELQMFSYHYKTFLQYQTRQTNKTFMKSHVKK